MRRKCVLEIMNPSVSHFSPQCDLGAQGHSKMPMRKMLTDRKVLRWFERYHCTLVIVDECMRCWLRPSLWCTFLLVIASCCSKTIRAIMCNEKFINRLPEARLGKSHPSLDAFRQATQFTASKTKEYTLVVVTTSHNRILLGLKNRGFGKGMYNSFGGKFDHPEESVEECACRELNEEANIAIPLQEMRKHKVGIQRYTFENDPLEMVMHLFRIHLDEERMIQNIRGCEEITPKWFEDWYKIPLDNMFADDSHWLTALLASPKPLEINGWYHFRENCQETNTVLHYYMDVKPKESFTEKEADQQI